ncbi:MAG: hypothetical protein M3R62_08125 [Acidobacteriota bacterium]|nr:hypothetical protein [Acidobacteriota bacterium]MDQ2979173.1 hypothetical protein [Acidobacteriota bacterium]
MKETEKDRSERLRELTRRGAAERDRLADAVGGVAADVRQRRTAWKIAGLAATSIAAAGTAAYKLFGKSSPAARIGRAASATSIVLGLGRALLRIRRFL